MSQKYNQQRNRQPYKKTKNNSKKNTVTLILLLCSVILCIYFLTKNPSETIKTKGDPLNLPESGTEIDLSSYTQTNNFENSNIDNNNSQNNVVDYKITDPFLLLVNYENPLPSDFNITPTIIRGDVEVDDRIYDALNDLLKDSESAGVNLWLASGYRSVDLQTTILDREIELGESKGMDTDEARQAALQTIAEPGYSEHHTGLAIDFNTVSADFEFTDEYKWLKENAANYGFVQRYSEEKVHVTKILEEVWHYRYVGVEHAKEMNSLNMCLEEYLDYLKQQGRTE